MMASESAGMLASGKITPQKCLNMKHPYEHQDEAMMSLDRMEKKSPSYSTLVVLPTGGGKTYTAATWLLRTALDRKKKVLWMAHRHLLLDQAAASFRQYAYESVIPHIDSFQYRVVSGAANHDRVANITPEDDLLIISKDSIAQHPSCLDEWLEGVRELYCIVDEAHHSTAKSYRKAIEYLQSKIPELKLIGLTATPFRKDIDDPGLLGEIYRDDIVYQIGLNALIARRILATPYFNDCPTSQDYGQELGLRALESIQRSDQIPDEIAGQMAKSVARNQCIVDAYLANKKMYGQTIVFAINVIHAVQLAGAFLDAGIKADYIVSGVRDSSTGAITKTSENEEKLEAYRRGELKVLISVNILTEGVDLPSTKTVFLTRPTVSAVLMTQMVGRALRGVKAGGTSDAHIVCFIDNWGSRIAWVNPQSLFQGLRDSEDEVENRAKSTIRTIAVAKIEEFARMLDESVDTTDLERLPFCERIPQKVYFIRLEEQGEDGADIFYQVIVYNNSVEAYNQLMEDLPVLFDSYAATEEFLPEELLQEMERHCYNTYFTGEMVPPYQQQDVINILKYYAQYGKAPRSYTFDEIDRGKLDVQKIAQHIWDNRLTREERWQYENALWEDSDDNLLQLFFGKKLYFLRQIDLEYAKLASPELYAPQNTVRYGDKELEDLPLAQVRDIAPDTEQKLRHAAFENFKREDGQFRCAKCGTVYAEKIRFHVTHILPMEQGGKSVPENMQIICYKCYEEYGK